MEHTKQCWLESNDYGKELFVDEILATNAKLLAALEGLVLAFGENDGRIPADGGALSIDEQEAINFKALQQARATIAEAKGEQA